MDHKFETIITIAVASDLHASTKKSSKLFINAPNNGPTENPFLGLHELIQQENLKAELLLCPGDMTDKAVPEGVKYAWDQLHQTGKLLGTFLTTATVGNHDIDSRENTGAEDPKELLQQLSPGYPLPDQSLINDYWANQFTIFQNDAVSLILLNTCHKHTKPEELERGYITTHTLNRLKNSLKNLKETPVKLLLCHHHPHQHSEYELGDKDVMKNGQLLLDLLAAHGDWLVIHGHKHFPKLSYAAGGASSPLVFAAGSFAGDFGSAAETRTRNQFHLVEIVRSPTKPYALYGFIRSWNWAFGSGWIKSMGGMTGLPATVGFGSRLHPAELAELCARKMAKSRLKKWAELCTSLPELRFQLPQDYEKLKMILKSVHGLSLQEEQGVPYELGKSK